MSNSIKAKATRKTTPAPRNFAAKTLRDCKEIIKKWRSMGLPDKSLLEAFEVVAGAVESIDDPAKAKTKAREAFDRVMQNARANKAK